MAFSAGLRANLVPSSSRQLCSDPYRSSCRKPVASITRHRSPQTLAIAAARSRLAPSCSSMPGSLLRPNLITSRNCPPARQQCTTVPIADTEHDPDDAAQSKVHLRVWKPPWIGRQPRSPSRDSLGTIGQRVELSEQPGDDRPHRQEQAVPEFENHHSGRRRGGARSPAPARQKSPDAHKGGGSR